MCDTCGCEGPSSSTEIHDHGHGPHSHGRLINVQANLLSTNSQIAQTVRKRLVSGSVLALNLVSSPGAGKTTLLVKTLEALLPTTSVAVVEGDQQTSNDAEQIRATGASAIQINTGKGCHLEARSVRDALDKLKIEARGILFIENVGNLVCPALFDLGEAHKVVVLSVPEGDDKPAKYPHMFAASDLMIINKTDLLPYVDFDVERCAREARRVNPDIDILMLSAKTGEGLADWFTWIETHRSSIGRRGDPDG